MSGQMTSARGNQDLPLFGSTYIPIYLYTPLYNVASRLPLLASLESRTHLQSKDPTNMSALTNTDLPNLKLVAKGKVRDIYALPSQEDADKLLFVATDRISAFDIIMENVSTTTCFLS